MNDKCPFCGAELNTTSWPLNTYSCGSLVDGGRSYGCLEIERLQAQLSQQSAIIRDMGEAFEMLIKEDAQRSPRWGIGCLDRIVIIAQAILNRPDVWAIMKGEVMFKEDVSQCCMNCERLAIELAAANERLKEAERTLRIISIDAMPERMRALALAWLDNNPEPEWIPHLHCSHCEYPVDLPPEMILVSRRDLKPVTDLLEVWRRSKMTNSKELNEHNECLRAALGEKP